MESPDLYELYKDQIEQVIQLGIPRMLFKVDEPRTEADLRKTWKSNLSQMLTSANSCWMYGVYLNAAAVESLLSAAEEILLLDGNVTLLEGKRENISRLRRDLDREFGKIMRNCACSEKPKEEIKHA